MFKPRFFTHKSLRQFSNFSLEPIKQQAFGLMQKFSIPICYSDPFVNKWVNSHNAPKALQQATDIQHCDNMITGLKLFLFQQKQLKPAIYMPSLTQLTDAKNSYIANHANKDLLKATLQLHHEISLEKMDVSWDKNLSVVRILCGMLTSLYHLIDLLVELSPQECFVAFYVEQYHLYREMVATENIPDADLRIFGIKLYNDIMAILRQSHPEIFTKKKSSYHPKISNN